MPTTGIIKGTSLKIFNNTAEINHCTEATLSLSKTIIDTTSKDSNAWRTTLEGTKQWTLTGTAYVAYDATEGVDELLSDFNTDATVSVELTTDVTGDASYTGTGRISSFEKTGNLDEAAQFSFTIEGTGALTITTVT